MSHRGGRVRLGGHAMTGAASPLQQRRSPRPCRASWRVAGPLLVAVLLLQPVSATQCLPNDVHLPGSHVQQMCDSVSVASAELREGTWRLPSLHPLPCHRAVVCWVTLGYWLGLGLLLVASAVHRVIRLE